MKWYDSVLERAWLILKVGYIPSARERTFALKPYDLLPFDFSFPTLSWFHFIFIWERETEEGTERGRKGWEEWEGITACLWLQHRMVCPFTMWAPKAWNLMANALTHWATPHPHTLPLLHCILSYIPFFIAWLTCLFLPSWHWTPNSLASTLRILRTQACATVPGPSVLFQSVRYFMLVSIFVSCCMCGSNLSPSY